MTDDITFDNANLPKYEVLLKGVAETALIPLHARAVDGRSPNPILGDKYAQNVVNQLDYDFSKVSLSQSESLSVALRTQFFDGFVTSFLKNHQTATVLQLGSGLDTRALRLDWGDNIGWVDIDFPEVVALRQSILPPVQSTRDYRLIAADINDTESWLKDVPVDRPTVIIMEGFMSFLKIEERDLLLSRLADYFEEADIITDCVSTQLLALGDRVQIAAVRQTGAELRSAVGDSKELEAVHRRLQHVKTVRFVELPGIQMLPWATRIQLYLLSWTPGWRDSARFLHYEIVPRDGNK